LAQDDYTEVAEGQQDESMDSPVMKALRKQIKDLTQLVNNAPTRESIEAEIRAQLDRNSAISEQLIALGHPAGMSEVIRGQLGEGEVTLESVASALQTIGYKVEVANGPEGEDTVQDTTSSSDLANISNLSAQVRSAAGGDVRMDGVSKVNQASTQAELIELMRKDGLLSDNS
jgi:hypothetical protein